MHAHHPLLGKDWNTFCAICLQDRLKLFLWKCLQSALPLRGVMLRFIDAAAPEAALCPFCAFEIETAEHLFMRCQIG